MLSLDGFSYCGAALRRFADFSNDFNLGSGTPSLHFHIRKNFSPSKECEFWTPTVQIERKYRIKIIFFDMLIWHYWCHFSAMLDWQLILFFQKRYFFNTVVFALEGVENLFFMAFYRVQIYPNEYLSWLT